MNYLIEAASRIYLCAAVAGGEAGIGGGLSSKSLRITVYFNRAQKLCQIRAAVHLMSVSAI